MTKIYVKINNIDIRYSDIARLLPRQWVNDELINCFMSILTDENKV
jgi:Ulp1 family protease